MKIENKKYCVLSLSGGLDSSTLLLHLLANEYNVTALSFNYGQKHSLELQRAQELVEYIKTTSNGFGRRQTGTLTHKIINIDGLGELLNSSLTTDSVETPEGFYSSTNMKLTVVQNRNKIFSSIIQAVALSIAEKNNTWCKIALGIHSGDHEIYLDCRQEFRDADYKAFLLGNENGKLVEYYTPYLKGDKYTILVDGLDCCSKLGLNFDEVYKRTNTSYAPNEKGEASGKTGADVERVLAFHKLGKKDPVAYADGWDKTLEYALKTEKEFLNK